MNCKNCGFPLNGNQTCPSCGTVNEINNTTPTQVVQGDTSVEPLPIEQAAPIVTTTAEAVQNVEPVQPVNSTIENPVVNNNVGPTPVAPVAPEITPIQSSSINTGTSYEEPKKKKTGLIILLIILALVIIGGGIFLGIKFLGNKPDTPVVEPTKEETKKEEEKDPDAKYASEQMFIDEMTNEELFNLVHETLDFAITDGQTLKDFYQSLAISKTGKEPSRISGGNGVDFEFLGVMLADTPRDYIYKINISCDYDFQNSLIYNPDSNSYAKSGSVDIKIYDDARAEEIYNSFKTQYSNLYPGIEVKDSKGSGGVYNGNWIQFDMKTSDNRSITVRLEEERSKDRQVILVYETVLK